ncbi:hypothetical protein [Chitinophaga vietnamensis]|uniref:hypothetical protein n=1 Tax=Chitinophaga vietnamensis TaxID=2593957 RepID=UPI001177934F|nr:hypothetical protein [Chitinophaga vietnamensis]
MYLFLLSACAVFLFLTILMYRTSFRKKTAIPVIIRSADILKFNSYKSYGIMALVQFKDEGLPQIGERIMQEGSTYKITGVVNDKPAPAAPRNEGIWECKLEKI